MDNLDDSENAKVSDSAYSNSCSNSQSRRSHSSKSTHSGSSVSGSSGYGGKPSTSGSSNKLEQTGKKDKEKKKKQSLTEVKVVEKSAEVECRPPLIPHFVVPKLEDMHGLEPSTTTLALPEKAVENMEVSTMDMKNEMLIATMQASTYLNMEESCQAANLDSAGFSCVISMHDGVVMYATQHLTTNLGFPKDMWIGRSFIDFVHPKDRNTFASQITNVLAFPKVEHTTIENYQTTGVTSCNMGCRIRRYRNLGNGFGIKNNAVVFIPFLLKFTFKDINKNDGKVVYLIIQATPIYSSYKTTNESLTNASPFVIRHSAAGLIEYIDMDAVPYLGYLPQDVQNKSALTLYHPDDLPYLKTVYESIVKEGGVTKSMPFRMLTQNGDYVKLEVEYSSFINPWSMKLEFVTGKHVVLQGPITPDVFLTPPVKPVKVSTDEENNVLLADGYRANILKILKDVPTKPAENAKTQLTKRCLDLAQIMENLQDDPNSDELRIDIHEPGLNSCERDSVMLGEISPHHDNDGKSRTGTPLSYNQLNYNDNLKRFFDSHENYYFEEPDPTVPITNDSPKASTSAYVSSEFNDQSSSGSSSAFMYYSLPSSTKERRVNRLTESLLTRHNHKMEKELVKCHRGTTRCNIKGGRDWDSRQKKKEHLARCNAMYQPTLADAAVVSPQAQGIKRPLPPTEEISPKQQCTKARTMRRRRVSNTDSTHVLPNTTMPNSAWPVSTDATNSTATFTPPVQQMIVPHMPVPMYPMYYPPNADPANIHNMHMTVSTTICQPVSSQSELPPLQMQMHAYTNATMSWMYPQAVFCNPYLYSPIAAYNNIQQQEEQQRALLAQSMAYNQSYNQSSLELPKSNYVQEPETWPKDVNVKKDVSKLQTTEAPVDTFKTPTTEPSSGQISDETMDKTDGESSYSTFYSSFFKTESGSAEDSSDPKKPRLDLTKTSENPITPQQTPKKIPPRKTVPSWMENVKVTPELIFRYQIPTRSKEEVLKADMEKLKKMVQPEMVNEQLAQLYLDLQLQGATSRLTLEEGITSSSSSDDCPVKPKVKIYRRKREYSKLSMIYEVDAPLPPPDDDKAMLCKEASPSQATSSQVPSPSQATSSQVPSPSQATSSQVPSPSQSTSSQVPSPSQSTSCQVPNPSESTSCQVPSPSQSTSCQVPSPSQSTSCQEPSPSQST